MKLPIILSMVMAAFFVIRVEGSAGKVLDLIYVAKGSVYGAKGSAGKVLDLIRAAKVTGGAKGRKAREPIAIGPDGSQMVPKDLDLGFDHVGFQAKQQQSSFIAKHVPTAAQAKLPQPMFFQFEVFEQGSLSRRLPARGLPLFGPLYPGLSWSQIGLEDGLNCGYHALKNLKIAVMYALDSCDQFWVHSPQIRRKMLDLQEVLNVLYQWVPIVYQSRQAEIIRKLRGRPFCPKELQRLLRQSEADRNFDAAKFMINQAGMVKINFLQEDEVNLLLDSLDPRLGQNIIIMTDQYLEMFGEKRIFASEKTLQHIERLERFIASENDTLGVMWTHAGYGHWVSVVFQKCHGVVRTYFMNSTSGPSPAKLGMLFDFVGFRRR